MPQACLHIGGECKFVWGETETTENGCWHASGSHKMVETWCSAQLCVCVCVFPRKRKPASHNARFVVSWAETCFFHPFSFREPLLREGAEMKGSVRFLQNNQWGTEINRLSELTKREITYCPTVSNRRNECVRWRNGFKFLLWSNYLDKVWTHFTPLAKWNFSVDEQ